MSTPPPTPPPAPTPAKRTPPPSPPFLAPASRAELRAWLAENHATSSGVSLAIGKKGTSATKLTYDDAVEEGLAFGWIDSTTRRLDDDRYTVQFTPRKRGSVWAQSNKDRVARLTAEGLMEPAGMAVVKAAQADGSWDRLSDVENRVIPDDLAEAFAATPGTAEKFAELSVSMQRQALYWLALAKRPETRAKRISDFITAAREGRSPV